MSFNQWAFQICLTNQCSFQEPKVICVLYKKEKGNKVFHKPFDWYQKPVGTHGFAKVVLSCPFSPQNMSPLSSSPNENQFFFIYTCTRKTILPCKSGKLVPIKNRAIFSFFFFLFGKKIRIRLCLPKSDGKTHLCSFDFCSKREEVCSTIVQWPMQGCAPQKVWRFVSSPLASFRTLSRCKGSPPSGAHFRCKDNPPSEAEVHTRAKGRARGTWDQRRIVEWRLESKGPSGGSNSLQELWLQTCLRERERSARLRPAPFGIHLT